MKKALFIAALLVLGGGSAASFYIAACADAGNNQISSEPRHVLMVPGREEVLLSRTGAYGIYYLHQPQDAEGIEVGWLADHLQCNLESETSGKKISAAADYLETNIFWEEGEYKGVLLMSITVGQPGAYTFDCWMDDGGEFPEVLVSLGPNNTWDQLHSLWEMRSSIMASISVLGGSVILSLALVVAGLVVQAKRSRASKGGAVL